MLVNEKGIFQIRTDRENAWASANPILARGEIGGVIENNFVKKIKIGDGETHWNNIPFIGTEVIPSDEATPEKITFTGYVDDINAATADGYWYVKNIGLVVVRDYEDRYVVQYRFTDNNIQMRYARYIGSDGATLGTWAAWQSLGTSEYRPAGGFRLADQVAAPQRMITADAAKQALRDAGKYGVSAGDGMNNDSVSYSPLDMAKMQTLILNNSEDYNHVINMVDIWGQAETTGDNKDLFVSTRGLATSLDFLDTQLPYVHYQFGTSAQYLNNYTSVRLQWGMTVTIPKIYWKSIYPAKTAYLLLKTGPEAPRELQNAYLEIKINGVAQSGIGSTGINYHLGRSQMIMLQINNNENFSDVTIEINRSHNSDTNYSRNLVIDKIGLIVDAFSIMPVNNFTLLQNSNTASLKIPTYYFIKTQETPVIFTPKAGDSKGLKTLVEIVPNDSHLEIPFGVYNLGLIKNQQRGLVFLSDNIRVMGVPDAATLKNPVICGTAAPNHSIVDGLIENGGYGNVFMDVDFVVNRATQDQGYGVALQATGDTALYKNCRIIGNQDTIVIQGGSHKFKDCVIEGTTDFICGRCASYQAILFEGCTVSLKGTDSYDCVAAPSEGVFLFDNTMFKNNDNYEFKSQTGKFMLGRRWTVPGWADKTCSLIFRRNRYNNALPAENAYGTMDLSVNVNDAFALYGDYNSQDIYTPDGIAVDVNSKLLTEQDQRSADSLFNEAAEQFSIFSIFEK